MLQRTGEKRRMSERVERSPEKVRAARMCLVEMLANSEALLTASRGFFQEKCG